MDCLDDAWLDGCRLVGQDAANTPFGRQGREAQEPPIRLLPSDAPNPEEQQAMQLANSSGLVDEAARLGSDFGEAQRHQSSIS